MALIVKSRTNEPVLTVKEAKDHLRETSQEESVNDYIEALVDAVVGMTEVKTQRAIGEQVLELTRDCFPACRTIKLERGPVHDVASVKYYDANGTLQTLSTSDYTKALKSSPARIVLNEDKSWPSTKNIPEAVIIEYTAGYLPLDTESTVERLKIPKTLKQAMLFLVAHWYANRESVVVGVTGLSQVPETFDAAVFPFKEHLGA